ARAEPLPLAGADAETEAHRGLPCDQARAAVAEGSDPDRVHEPGVLRQPRVRDRGGGGDVLLAHGEEPEPRAGGTDRGPAAGTVELRPVPEPGGGARSTEPSAERDARERRHHLVAIR